MQIALQPFGGYQPVQQFPPLLGSQIEPGALPFQPFLNPAFFGGLVDVHVFGANRADVHITDQRQNFAQAPLRGRDQRAGVEHRTHVGFAQAVIAGIEFGHWRTFAQLQGIELGSLVTTGAIGVDDAQHRRLFFGGGGTERLLAAPNADAGLLRQPGERVTDRAVGDIASALGLGVHSAEILLPVVADRFRVAEKALVQVFNKCRIPAEQRRTLLKLLDECGHCRVTIPRW